MDILLSLEYTMAQDIKSLDVPEKFTGDFTVVFVFSVAAAAMSFAFPCSGKG
jgi:hypothetical protein